MEYSGWIEEKQPVVWLIQTALQTMSSFYIFLLACLFYRSRAKMHCALNTFTIDDRKFVFQLKYQR